MSEVMQSRLVAPAIGPANAGLAANPAKNVIHCRRLQPGPKTRRQEWTCWRRLGQSCRSTCYVLLQRHGQCGAHGNESRLVELCVADRDEGFVESDIVAI